MQNMSSTSSLQQIVAATRQLLEDRIQVLVDMHELAGSEKAIIDAFITGYEDCDEEARFAFLEQTFGPRHKAMAAVLETTENNYAQMKRRKRLSKTCRESLDQQYGPDIEFPSEDAAWANGFAGAMTVAQKHVLKRACRHSLTVESCLGLAIVLQSAEWAEACKANSIRDLKRAGGEIIQKLRQVPGLKPPWLVANAFDLAAIVEEWSESFLICASIIPRQLS